MGRSSCWRGQGRVKLRAWHGPWAHAVRPLAGSKSMTGSTIIAFLVEGSTTICGAAGEDEMEWQR